MLRANSLTPAPQHGADAAVTEDRRRLKGGTPGRFGADQPPDSHTVKCQLGVSVRKRRSEAASKLRLAGPFSKPLKPPLVPAGPSADTLHTTRNYPLSCPQAQLPFAP